MVPFKAKGLGEGRVPELGPWVRRTQVGTGSPQLCRQDTVSVPSLQFLRVLFCLQWPGGDTPLPPPRQNFPVLDGGNSESGWAWSGLALFSNSGKGGGRDHKTERRGPTLNLGTDSSSSLFLVQIPTTRGSSTISTGRLLDICGQR